MTLEDLHYYQNYYTFNRRLYRLTGLWPYQETSKRLFRVRFINSFLFFSIFVQTLILLMSEMNMAQTITLLPTLLPAICFTSVYNNVHLNYDRRRNLFDRIRSDWIELKDQRSTNVMRKFAKENRQYTLKITVLIYLYGILLIIPSIIQILLNASGIKKDIQLTLPIPINFALRNKLCYYMMLWLQFICICIACTIGIAHYTLYITFIQHTYALCGIVSIMLNKPFKKNSRKSCPSQSDCKHTQEYHWIIDAIECYEKVTSFVDLTNGIYSNTFMVEVVTGLLYVIMDYFYFFELINTSANVSEILTCCIYIAAPFFILYAICFLGQRLLDYNVDIYIKCCQIPFYAYSLETQKALQLLIMRSMRPFGLSMKGVLVTSHELFANIIRTSFSFATVFYKMR